MTRAEKVAVIRRYQEAGYAYADIAVILGMSRSGVRNLVNDPDGSKQRARRVRYQGTCEGCGAPTDGSNGRAKAPKLCEPCHRAIAPAQHGTLSKYRGGCRCDDCRRAVSDYTRAIRTSGKEPPTHGYSGYINYGCRCDTCRTAHSAYLRAHPEHKQRWLQKVRGTEPPRHGAVTAYNVYGCRCDECREASRAYQRAYRERQKAAA